MKKYNVAILGATGAVGTEFLKLIEERDFPFAELRLLASARSAGTQLTVKTGLGPQRGNPAYGKRQNIHRAGSERRFL